MMRVEGPTVDAPLRACGRTHPHREHGPYVQSAKSSQEFWCDGSPAPRSVTQLVAERPVLRELRGGAGVGRVMLAVSAA